MPVVNMPSAVVNPKVFIAGVELNPIKQNVKLHDKKLKVERLKLKSSLFSFV